LLSLLNLLLVQEILNQVSLSFKTGGSRESRHPFLFLPAAVATRRRVAAADMPPFSSDSESTEVAGFRKTCSTDIDGRFPIAIYESCGTGLTVAFAQVDGPLVAGYIALGEYNNVPQREGSLKLHQEIT
jgi:hypothetical protein